MNWFRKPDPKREVQDFLDQVHADREAKDALTPTGYTGSHRIYPGQLLRCNECGCLTDYDSYKKHNGWHQALGWNI